MNKEMRILIKKFTALFLSLTLLVGLMPRIVQADTIEEISSKKVDYLATNYSLYDDGVSVATGSPIYIDGGELTLNAGTYIESAGDIVSCKFTVPADGTYYFFSEGDCDTYGTLYVDGLVYDDNDDSGAKGNFLIERYLYEGEICEIRVSDINCLDFACSVYVCNEREADNRVMTIVANNEEIYCSEGDRCTLNTNIYSVSGKIMNTLPEGYSFKWYCDGEFIEYNSADYYIDNVRFDEDYIYYECVLYKGNYVVDTAEFYINELLEYTNINLDTPYRVTDSSENAYIKFTALETGYYKFTAKNIEGDNYLYGILSNDYYFYDWEDYEGYSISIRKKIEAGETYYFRTESEDGDGSYEVLVTKAPEVTSIELVSGEVGPLRENVDGYWYEDIEANEFFYYYYELSYYDIQLRINYSDGTSILASPGEWIDGERVDDYDNQDYEPWVVGNKNVVTVTYNGVSVDIPVVILENKIKSIEVEKNPNVDYMWANNKYGYLEDGYYSFTPDNFSGMELKVHYKDGTSETFTGDDIDSKGYLNGYYIDVSYLCIEEPGTYTATLTYMGVEADYTVKVIDKTLSSFEVIKDPNVTTLVHTPDFVGMQVKMLFTDDTSTIITVTEENITYYTGQIFYCSVIDGEIAFEIEENYNGDGWIVSTFGNECIYYGINSIEGKEIKDISASNVSVVGTGMVINVTYTDNTKEIIVVENINGHRFEGSNPTWGYGLTKTANGIVRYEVEALDISGDKNIDKYIVSILGRDVEVAVEDENSEEPTTEQPTTEQPTTVIKPTTTQQNTTVAPTTKQPTTVIKPTITTVAKDVKVANTKVKKAEKKKTAKKAKISLKKIKNVDGYQIKISTTKKFSKKKTVTKNSKKNAVTVKKLKPKKKYFVKARCYKIVNGKKKYSNWSKVKKVKMK